MALHVMYVSGIFVFNFSPCLSLFFPHLNIIVKQRDYLYLQLNANFIQAFKQYHIHSLNQMII